MRRRVFDALVSAGGGVLVVVLIVAGALLLWGHSFANSNVKSQLAQQQIFFPEKGSSDLSDPKIGPYLKQYAGQEVLTGRQAQAYADHYIAVHLRELPHHGVYAALSAASRANPNDATLKAAVETSFKGTTLRGLLLEAYGFWTFGHIALLAAIAAFILAAVMSMLVGLGLWHSRRVAATAEL